MSNSNSNRTKALVYTLRRDMCMFRCSCLTDLQLPPHESREEIVSSSCLAKTAAESTTRRAAACRPAGCLALGFGLGGGGFAVQLQCVAVGRVQAERGLAVPQGALALAHGVEERRAEVQQLEVRLESYGS